MGCHGPVGVSPVPAFPNLAGQHAEYLYWQLTEFKREARPESPMTAQVANLDDAAMRDLAVYFSSLPAATPTPGTTSSERGSQLYREGDAGAGVPPCQGCHGRNAQGHPLAQDDAQWRAYPALRGQHAAYLAQRLKDFRDGKHTLSSNDRIMTPIARALDDTSIMAITAWLESPTP
jgi:cytochrome c553